MVQACALQMLREPTTHMSHRLPATFGELSVLAPGWFSQGERVRALKATRRAPVGYVVVIIRIRLLLRSAVGGRVMAITISDSEPRILLRSRTHETV